MPKFKPASKKSAVPTTEAELAKLELDAVTKLSEVLPTWYDVLGPGLDTVIVGIGNLVLALDEAAAAAGSGADFAERYAATQAILNSLAVPKLPNHRQLRAARLKELGGKKKAESLQAYERKTICMLAQDLPDWYKEVGIGGFARSLLELHAIAGKLFKAALDDEDRSADEVFMLTAFQLREAFGKVPKEVLEALHMLAETHDAEAATTTP